MDRQLVVRYSWRHPSLREDLDERVIENTAYHGCAGEAQIDPAHVTGERPGDDARRGEQHADCDRGAPGCDRPDVEAAGEPVDARPRTVRKPLQIHGLVLPVPHQVT